MSMSMVKWGINYNHKEDLYIVDCEECARNRNGQYCCHLPGDWGCEATQSIHGYCVIVNYDTVKTMEVDRQTRLLDRSKMTQKEYLDACHKIEEKFFPKEREESGN